MSWVASWLVAGDKISANMSVFRMRHDCFKFLNLPLRVPVRIGLACPNAFFGGDKAGGTRQKVTDQNSFDMLAIHRSVYIGFKLWRSLCQAIGHCHEMGKGDHELRKQEQRVYCGTQSGVTTL